MNRNQFYYKQLVNEFDLDQIFQSNIEKALGLNIKEILIFGLPLVLFFIFLVALGIFAWQQRLSSRTPSSLGQSLPKEPSLPPMRS